MRKELEVFENRSDDWLAKQRALEERTSVWDFDEAKKLKADHERKHQIYERKYSLKNKVPKFNNVSQSQEIEAKKLAVLITTFALMIMIFSFIAMIMGY